MRSAPEKATVRLVDDVSASRDELVALLKQAGAVPKVRVVKSTGEVVVELEATQAVRDILSGDPLRMYPDEQGGRITVVLRPVKPKP
jgi:CheY-like chemotaxis protein